MSLAAFYYIYIPPSLEGSLNIAIASQHLVSRRPGIQSNSTYWMEIELQIINGRSGRLCTTSGENIVKDWSITLNVRSINLQRKDWGR